MMKQLIVMLLLVGSSVAIYHKGVDAINSLSTSTASCLAGKVNFFVGRILHSTGATDTAGITNIVNAQKAGLTTYAYMFPCTTCSGTSQITNAINSAKSAGAKMTRVFLDVEIYQWSSNQASNQNLITEYLNAGSKAGASMAIYTSANNWNTIVGSWTGCKRYDLWYAHYDGKENFDDFTSFGGWTSPYMKQYNQNVAECSYNTDVDCTSSLL